jgi:hypothetical protein
MKINGIMRIHNISPYGTSAFSDVRLSEGRGPLFAHPPALDNGRQLMKTLLDGLLEQTQHPQASSRNCCCSRRADARTLILRTEAGEFSTMCHDLAEDAEALAL